MRAKAARSAIFKSRKNRNSIYVFSSIMYKRVITNKEEIIEDCINEGQVLYE